MSIYDKASLVLIPSGTKTSKVYSQKPTNGDGDFTFSRSTAATRVNASGNIEKETQNLLLQSNSFDTTWATLNASVTGGQADKDGGTDAWLLQNTGSSGRVYQTLSASGVLTYSVYAKAGNVNWMALYVNASPYQYIFFDLANVAIGTDISGNSIDATITDEGSGWVRCSVSLNPNGNTTDFRVFPASGNGGLASSGQNIYIQDAQLEQGLVARDYIETTTTAIYGGITDNVPRLDYQGSCPALLLEPQRTNALTHSEYFGGWSNATTDVTLELVSSGAPDGGAFYRCTSGASGSGRIVRTYTGSMSGAVYSIYAKGSGSIQINLWVTGGSNIYVDVALTSEWTRYDVYNPQVGAGGDAAVWFYPNGVADIWGAQVESGSYATSYIPTYGSAVTRNADYMTTILLDTKSIIPDNESWSAFFEVELLGNDSPNDKIQLSDDSNNPRAFLYANFAGVTGTGWSGTEALAMNINNKIMYRGNSSTNITFFENGVNAETFSNTGNPLTFNRMNFYGNNGAFRLKRAILFPTALTDQEAIDLTTL